MNEKASLPYDDTDAELTWVFVARGRALIALGRYDEALADFRRACEVARPDDAVRITLRLAALLAGLKRPQEALESLPPLDKQDVHTRARGDLIRVMAASELGDSSITESAVQDLKGSAPDDRATLEKALIVADRTDEAAQVLVARLSDPDFRSDALEELQDFVELPDPAPISSWKTRLAALRTRPDVRRSIDSYGRVRSYRIADDDF
jgi:tetratricopeptide (TPR) repeat protein